MLCYMCLTYSLARRCVMLLDFYTYWITSIHESTPFEKENGEHVNYLITSSSLVVPIISSSAILSLAVIEHGNAFGRLDNNITVSYRPQKK